MSAFLEARRRDQALAPWKARAHIALFLPDDPDLFLSLDEEVSQWPSIPRE